MPYETHMEVLLQFVSVMNIISNGEEKKTRLYRVGPKTMWIFFQRLK